MKKSISSSRQGVALVIVLAVLVLLSALLVSFMGTVTSERASSRLAVNTFEARQAAESAVNLVIAQIRAATSANDQRTAWASQPGVIRTFDSSARGIASDKMVYKLYSSDQMQVPAANYNPGSPTESGLKSATDLVTVPDGFVDLNLPVLVPISKTNPADPDRYEPRYPIADPRARLTRNGQEPQTASEYTNPSSVEGFFNRKVVYTPARKDALNRDIELLPMRVKWLYQLKDGTFVAPDPNTQLLAGASKTNPPIARVAFWTDDESAKINLNTASENTYWDTPHTSTYQESGNVNSGDGSLIYDPGNTLSLAASQPTAREYQRFPGHPATTSLSPALRWMAPVGMSEADFKEAIYRLAPRIMGGPGSTVSASRNPEFDTDTRVTDRDRLFATIDEYWFRPDRTPLTNAGLFNVFRQNGAASAPDTPFLASTTDASVLERMRFFLTANSRSPEVNLFGYPRVSIWPVHERDDPNPVNSRRTAFDDLMVFCSTVAGRPYYFTRANPWSPTFDFEQSGIGPNSGRNKILVDAYLKRLCSLPIPGVGRSMVSKYNQVVLNSQAFNELDRILLSIFDYIRSTNLVDTGRRTADGTPPAPSPGNYPLAYTPGYALGNNYSGNVKPNLGSGQVVPTVRYDANTKPLIKGFGRFITLSEMGILFYVDDTVLPGDIPPNPPAPATGVSQDWLPIRAVLIPETFTVSPGYPALSEGYAYRIREITPLTVSPSNDPTRRIPLNIADGSYNYVEADPWRVGDGRFFMPTRGFSNHFVYDAAGPGNGQPVKVKAFVKPNHANDLPTNDYSRYPFYSQRVFLPATRNASGQLELPSKFNFNGGTLEIEFYPLQIANAQAPPSTSLATAPIANIARPLQTIRLSFPATRATNPAEPITLPTPIRGERFPDRIGAAGANVRRPHIKPYSERSSYAWINFQNNKIVFDNYVIRSIVPSGPGVIGDYRQIAGSTFVHEGAYQRSGAPGAYDSDTIRAVHHFSTGWGQRYTSDQAYGQLWLGAKPRLDKSPDVPAVNGSAVLPGLAIVGDFDRGLSKHTDGPFINKADEGNVRFNLTDNPGGGGHLPYYRGANGYDEVGETYFTPNRLMASAVMFGSLPTGVISNRPWETLLFSPAINAAHRGAQDPPDHYLLDLFHMPVVEPYAISEPLSTAGKINLNNRIAPFGYAKGSDGRGLIERNTGLHAVLKGMYQLAVESGAPDAAHLEEPLKDRAVYRHEIDRYGTIRQVIEPRVDANRYFRSPTEICELDLLIRNKFTNPASRATFWSAHGGTGDNQRERAYAHIFPRLTTKSNVYTVHFWAQSIAKGPATTEQDWARFDEKRDRITGEYRGSTTIERYIDPNEPALNGYDAATNNNAPSLDTFYRFRVVNHRRFVAK